MYRVGEEEMKLISCLLLLVICACDPQCLGTLSVKSFSDRSASWEHKTFAVVPNEKQEASLEYKKLASHIVVKLKALGFGNATHESNADFKVFFDISAKELGTEIEKVGEIFGDKYEEKGVSRKVEATVIDLKIVDSKSSVNILEAIAIGDASYRERLLRDMIDAIFKNFMTYNDGEIRQWKIEKRK
jgi:hypothetical protein